MKKTRYRMKPRVGPHYLDGKRYDPGDIIELHEYQIPIIHADFQINIRVGDYNHEENKIQNETESWSSLS